MPLWLKSARSSGFRFHRLSECVEWPCSTRYGSGTGSFPKCLHFLVSDILFMAFRSEAAGPAIRGSRSAPTSRAIRAPGARAVARVRSNGFRDDQVADVRVRQRWCRECRRSAEEKQCGCQNPERHVSPDGLASTSLQAPRRQDRKRAKRGPQQPTHPRAPCAWSVPPHVKLFAQRRWLCRLPILRA